MQVQLVSQPLEQVEADALVAVLFENESVPAELGFASKWLEQLHSSTEFTGKPGELAVVHQPAGVAAKRLAVVGAGKRDAFDGAAARRVAGTAARALKSKGVRSLAWISAPEGGHIEASVEGVLLGNYEPDQYKTSDKGKLLDSLSILAQDTPENRAALRHAGIVAGAQNFARDLVNEPANRLTPSVMAERARAMADEAGLECEVLDRDRLRQLGMGALLGVAQGSDEPPALIVVRYQPESKPENGDHLGLVGKGVTFDSGGISIKPAEGMEKMKYDMGGAGAVLGAMRAIAELKPAIPVTAVVAAVENMVSGRAQRPGDIVTSLNGKTVEVLNTDAEGRLILIDAITYAQKLGCTHLVDAATLTGAVVVALGHVNIGVFTNNDELLHRVMAAAKGEGEKAWQLPMDDEYKELLKSSFADLANIGGRWGGSISAAWFLREFAGETPWVHLDIAGTAWLDDAKPHMAKGPTGVPVRTFARLAADW